MKFRHCFCLAVIPTLLLAGCGGSPGMGTQQQSYQLTVAKPAAGAGTITSSPAGINCPTTCTASYPQNTQVTLTATPGANYTFGGWSGSCSGTGTCSLTITAAASVTAAMAASGHRSGVRTLSPAPSRYTRCAMSMA